jgi:hypothetical protein
VGALGTVCWACAVRSGGHPGWQGQFRFTRVVQLVRYPPDHIASLEQWATNRVWRDFMHKIFTVFPVKVASQKTGGRGAQGLQDFNPAVLPSQLRAQLGTWPIQTETLRPTYLMMVHMVSWNALIQSGEPGREFRMVILFHTKINGDLQMIIM